MSSGATAWAGRAKNEPGRESSARVARCCPWAMDTPAFNLGTVLLFGSGLFVLATLFFGTKGGYYDTDDYDGNGTAH